MVTLRCCQDYVNVKTQELAGLHCRALRSGTEAGGDAGYVCSSPSPCSAPLSSSVISLVEAYKLLILFSNALF